MSDWIREHYEGLAYTVGSAVLIIALACWLASH